MARHLFRFVYNLKLRWKLLVVVLPLVVLPLFAVGVVISYIATEQAYRGVTQASKDDLDHMARFTLDLLDSHHQQFQVYKSDKKKTVQEEMKTLTNLAYSLVEAQHRNQQSGRTSLTSAKEQAKRALKQVNIGETGYIYAMTSQGLLTVHVAQEGENIYDERDEEGRFFIRAMCKAALKSDPGKVLFIVYPWRNAILGDAKPRQKVVAYRYFPEWDWIIATGGYLEETYEDLAFEQRSFEDLKAKIKAKQVGKTGYIYCLDSKGNLTVHPQGEGTNLLDARDANGLQFIREMVVKKNGWIRYPWKNPGEEAPRMKLVRYRYFKPWDWVVAVGAIEDEFYQDANLIKGRIFSSLSAIVLVMTLFSVGMVFLAAKVLTDPIQAMMQGIRRIKNGRFDQQLLVETNDEMGELAAAFNRMTEIIKRNKEIEATLAQQGKMASLGVLSSGVAHEINNPLGVILGYASFIESKMSPEDPNYKHIHEIKRESKRCKKIVQDLLSYARTPKPDLEPTDINELLDQIVDFAANHTDMHHVGIQRQFAPDLPMIPADGDQLRQVAINLILNAGGAMEQGGTLQIQTRLAQDRHLEILFSDNGCGIEPENQEKIFEPFFTTRARGTGLGLAITRQIVEQHHGRIHLESEMGVGTTVTIRLPLSYEES